MKQALRGLFLLCAMGLLVHGLSGCSDPKPANQSLRLRADRMIEEGKTEDAIELLSQELAKRDLASPDGQDTSDEAVELRICLASAYAKRAGITIREIAKSIELSQSAAKISAVQPLSAPSQTDENAVAFENYILTSLKFVDSFESIPKVTPDQMPDLTEAIRILDSNRVKPAHGLVYSAILKIIKARSLIEMSQLMDGVFASVKSDGSCKIDVNVAIDHIQTICSIIISGLHDYEIAAPKTAASTKKDENVVASLSNSFGTSDQRAQTPFEIPSGALNQIYQLLGSGSNPVSCPTGDSAASTN